jgi:hypothetical protein
MQLSPVSCAVDKTQARQALMSLGGFYFGRAKAASPGLGVNHIN